MSLNCLIRRDDGIGRHEGLKIPWPEGAVRVQIPLALQIIIKILIWIINLNPLCRL